MKKFLSLVMALVMVMSLTVIGASAKDFTDDDTITYDEAIDVISTLGVVDGYNDGSFQPNTELNRGQAAKIICNLILGPAAASNLTATVAPFPDVPASHHFAGYISYCAQENIISGYNDGYFRPGNSLSGYAFMKMLLGALGYDQNNEDMVGSNWTIQVAKLVKGVGLDSDLDDDFVGSKNVTRQEACLYALNTLKSKTVEYVVPGAQISVNGVEINQKASKASYRTYPVRGNQGQTEEANWGQTGRGSIYNDGYIQFGEEHFARLVLNGGQRDSFQRPEHMWSYKGDKIGSYGDEPDATYEGTVTMADIYDDLGLTSTTKKFRMYIDGMPANLFYTLAAGNADYEDDGPSYLWKNGNRVSNNEVSISEGTIDENKLVGTGPGCTIEVYKTGTQDVAGTIVVVNTYIGEVIAVNAAEGKHAASIDIAPIGDDFDDATENAVLADQGVRVLEGDADLSDNFETTKFELGDIVTYNYAFKVKGDGNSDAQNLAGSNFTFDGNSIDVSGSPKKVAKAETVEGEVKSYTNQESFNLGGTEYKYSKMATQKMDIADVSTNVVVYLDKQGNALYFDEGKDNNKNYALVLDAGVRSIVGGNSYEAELLYSDGTTALVVTDKQYGGSNVNGDLGDTGADNTCLIGEWVFHRTDSRGRTVLTRIPSNANGTYTNMMVSTTHKDTEWADITDGAHVIGAKNAGSSATRVELVATNGVGTGGTVRVNAGTTIIVKTNSGNRDRFTVYDGVKALPFFDNLATPDTGATYTVKYSSLTRANQTYARFLYVDATSGDVKLSSRTNKDLFLVANASARDSYNSNGDHYYSFRGVVDGEIVNSINLNWDDVATRDIIAELLTPDADPDFNRMHNVLAINYTISDGLYEVAGADWIDDGPNNPNGPANDDGYLLPNDNTTTVERITKEAIFFSDGTSFDLANNCKFFRVENRDVNARVTASTWNAVTTGSHAAIGDRYAYLAVSLNSDYQATAIYWREMKGN